MDDSTEGGVQTKSSLVSRKRRKRRNVLTRMCDEYQQGALAVLSRCVKERSKVKVWTRNYRYVRGICVGYLVAFDKHWNLAMVDVDETYSNPVPKPTVKKKRVRKTRQKQNSELPLSNSPQPVSSMDLESGTGEAMYSRGQDTARISQETKDSVTSASELPSQTVPASKVVATSRRSDSQLKSGQKVTQHGQLLSSLSCTGLSSHSESVHEGSSVSTVQSQRSSSRSIVTTRGQSHSSGTAADLKSTSRSLSTTHSRSSDHGRSGSQGRSSYFSRRSSSSDRRHSGSVREHGDGGDRSLERPQRRPGDASDDRPRTSCNRESVLQRLGHRTDRASHGEREKDRRKYEVLEKPRTSCKERLEGRGSKVEETQSGDVALCQQPESQLRDDLDRLSMTVTGTSTARVKDDLETSTEYQPVLTRHVNQLFIRGDNVALVAILG